MDTTPSLRQVMRLRKVANSESMLKHNAQNEIAHTITFGLMAYQLQQAFSANPDRIEKSSSKKMFSWLCEKPTKMTLRKRGGGLMTGQGVNT